MCRTKTRGRKISILWFEHTRKKETTTLILAFVTGGGRRQKFFRLAGQKAKTLKIYSRTANTSRTDMSTRLSEPIEIRLVMKMMHTVDMSHNLCLHEMSSVSNSFISSLHNTNYHQPVHKFTSSENAWVKAFPKPKIVTTRSSLFRSVHCSKALLPGVLSDATIIPNTLF